MGLLGDEAQVESRFDTFGDRATLDARLLHGLRRTYHNLVSICFGTVLASVQDRCSVCVKSTIGS
jgi:hypothetical protein